MRIDNDVTLLRLPENLCQFYDRKLSRHDNVLEHAPRSDARQLVHIPNQNQPCAGHDRLEQRIHQRQVYHRHLINDHSIRLKRIALIPPKTDSFLPAQFQHPVNRARLVAGRLTHTLCRASGRCGEQEIEPFQIKIMDDRVDRRCFSGSRPSCEHKHTLARRCHNRLPLVIRQLKSGRLLDMAQAFIHMCFGNVHFDVEFLQSQSDV